MLETSVIGQVQVDFSTKRLVLWEAASHAEWEEFQEEAAFELNLRGWVGDRYMEKTVNKILGVGSRGKYEKP